MFALPFNVFIFHVRPCVDESFLPLHRYTTLTQIQFSSVFTSDSFTYVAWLLSLFFVFEVWPNYCCCRSHCRVDPFQLLLFSFYQIRQRKFIMFFPKFNCVTRVLYSIYSWIDGRCVNVHAIHARTHARSVCSMTSEVWNVICVIYVFRYHLFVTQAPSSSQCCLCHVDAVVFLLAQLPLLVACNHSPHSSAYNILLTLRCVYVE